MKKFVAESDIALKFTAYDETGTVIDLTGASITFVLKQKSSDATALITKTVGSGITITSAANGQYTVSLDPADTPDFTGTYVFECKITDNSGNIIFTRSQKGNLISIEFDDNIIN